MQHGNLTRTSLGVLLASTFLLAYAFGNPVGPGLLDPNCEDCQCVQTSYWWTNGDNESIQCRYHPFNGGMAISDHANSSMFAATPDPGTATITDPVETITKYVPSSTRRTCWGAPNGRLEKLVADSTNINAATTSTYSRFTCQ